MQYNIGINGLHLLGSQSLEDSVDYIFLPEFFVFFDSFVPHLFAFVRVPKRLGQLGNSPIPFASKFIAEGSNRFSLENNLIM